MMGFEPIERDRSGICACLPRPRRGGHAFRLVWTRADGSEEHYDVTGQGFVGATNNQMELTACVEALKHVCGRHSAVPSGAYRKIVIYADSAYVVDNADKARRSDTPHWAGRRRR
jgi:ribonuclease HI